MKKNNVKKKYQEFSETEIESKLESGVPNPYLMRTTTITYLHHFKKLIPYLQCTVAQAKRITHVRNAARGLYGATNYVTIT